MASYLIVLFDHSGSMDSGFRGEIAEEHRGGLVAFAPRDGRKIDEAKAQVLSFLRRSDYDFATIIPFSSEPGPKLTFAVRNELDKAESYIMSIEAGGNTNLAAALRIAILIGKAQPEEAYVQHLIITDGLSHTQDDDIKLVRELPPSQGVNGLLIDPTAEGEHHLARVCVRGTVTPVRASRDLRMRLEEHATSHAARTALHSAYQKAMSGVREVVPRLRQARSTIASEPVLGDIVGRALSRAAEQVAGVQESARHFREALADARVSEDVLGAKIGEVRETWRRVLALADAVEEYCPESPEFRVSIGYPSRFAKGFAAPVLIQVYPPNRRQAVRRRLERELQEWLPDESISDTSVLPGMFVTLRLESPVIAFSEPVQKTIADSGASASFTAIPDESCRPGRHNGVLRIRDAKTSRDYETVPFTMRVVDYAFDHVSRPLLARLVSYVVGLGALTTFILGLLARIDQTFGLTSGTAGGAVAIYLYVRMLKLYGRPQTNAE